MILPLLGTWFDGQPGATVVLLVLTFLLCFGQFQLIIMQPVAFHNVWAIATEFSLPNSHQIFF